MTVDDKFHKEMPASEMSTLIQELQIRQVELEMQKEEIQKNQLEAEKSCETYRGLWEQSPVGCLVLDSTGRIMAVNRAGQRLFGRPEKTMLKTHLATLVTPENQMPIHVMLARSMEKGIPEKQEIRFSRPDGSIQTCLLEISPFGSAAGREHVQAVLTDITRQKRAEDDLRANEEEKIAILDSLLEHVIYHDNEMKILWANKAACESAQMQRADLLGRYCHEVWADRQTPCDDCPVIKALETGQPRIVQKMTPDGRWWHIEGHSVRDSTGHIKGTTETALDISERKRAEEAVLKAKNELEIKIKERTVELVEANGKLRQEIEGRKKVGQALIEKEKRYRKLFENMKNGLALYQPVDNGEDFVFVDFNMAAEKIDNIKREDLIGKSLLEMYPGARKFGLFDALQRVVRTGKPEHHPVSFYEDGRISGWRDNYIYRLPSGEVVAVYDDITERVQAQKELRKSESRYRALSEATFEAIFISEKGICLDTNQRATELFGYDYNELIGIFGTDVIADESKELVKRHMLSGYEKPYEAIAQKKDGTKFHVEIRGKMMKYKDKDVRMTVLRDISEHKRAVASLRESEKRYRNLFNSIPIGLYRTTPDGSIMDVNPAMLEILAYSDQDALLLVKAPEIYVDPDDRKQLKRLLAEKGFAHDFTVQMRRQDGRPVWVSLNAAIAHDANSQKTYYEGAMEDITDRKESEERIHELSQQLIRAQEDERQMLSRELHDTVAQDLTVAKMTIDLIHNDLSNDRPAETSRIKEISAALKKTILGVRNLAYELRPPGLEEMGLVETIYRFCEDFSQMWELPVDFQAAGLKGLELSYDIQINLYRLVQEGLTNVRKHAAAGRATVRMAAAFPSIILRIEDNGRGFEVNERAAAAGQEKRMGLRSMQERVTLLNGEMNLQSKPGKGTKVFIKLPFAENKHGTE